MFRQRSFIAVFVSILFVFTAGLSLLAQSPLGFYAQMGSAQTAQGPGDTALSPEFLLTGSIFDDFLLAGSLFNDDEDAQKLDKFNAAAKKEDEQTSQNSSDVFYDIDKISDEIEDLRALAERLRSEIDKDNERRDEIVRHIHDLDKSSENFASWLRELADESDMVLGWIIREQNQLEEVRWQIKDLEEKKWGLQTALAQKAALSSESP